MASGTGDGAAPPALASASLEQVCDILAGSQVRSVETRFP
jgi:hypothetical protein